MNERAWVVFWRRAANGNIEILLGKRGPKCGNPGQWGLPGGGVDAGEDWVTAAIREVHEEIGLPLSNVRYALEVEHYPGFEALVCSDLVSRVKNKIMYYATVELNENFNFSDLKVTEETVSYTFYNISNFLNPNAGPNELKNIHFSALRYLAYAYAFGDSGYGDFPPNKQD